MIGFLVVHLLGNLQVFAGAGVTPETTKLNEYALLLKKEPVLLWGARLFLILTAILHVMTTITLTQHNRDARPQHYEVRHSYASYASQMMIFGGLAILFYIVYHILHFTTGTVHADYFTPHDVYQNMIRSFQDPTIVGVYVAAQIALFAHLYHGTVSVFRTLGMNNPRHIFWIKKAGILFALIICGGFISIPVCIYFGMVS